ncbi:hypothetical protein CALVIDRAFT_554639 [Calocera viscosa TUFC12733]|uniref:CNH domain-containing protein n=1 Tax=Calocera viscosa (strain TUFC12733) TaxID=1330018 RepID=A0A167N7K3_CALVF|nr:hypothetical protein CALVIDRAFT_554639 [Calocera viscosa TUFC12733]
MYDKLRALVRKPREEHPADKTPGANVPETNEEPAQPEQLQDLFHLVQLGTSSSHPSTSDIPFTSKVLSVSTFRVPANRAVQLVVVACEDGIWFGRASDPSSIQLSIPLPKVTACALLPEEEVLLVISDRELLHFSAHALPPGQPKGPLQKLASNVEHLLTTQLQGRRAVVYSTRKGGDWKVHVLDIVEEEDLPARWGFQKLHELSIAFPFSALQPLTTRLALPTTSHWELLDPARFRTELLPHPSKPQPQPGRVRQQEEGRPLGCVELTEGEVLLVYSEYGIILHRSSKQVLRTALWKSRASQAAFHPPYLLLFAEGLIEVRHMATLALGQLLQAQGVRCVSPPGLVRRRGGLEDWETAELEAGEGEVWAVVSAGVGEGQRVVRLCPANV